MMCVRYRIVSPFLHMKKRTFISIWKTAVSTFILFLKVLCRLRNRLLDRNPIFLINFQRETISSKIPYWTKYWIGLISDLFQLMKNISGKAFFPMMYRAR